jgi:hypothetical protein
MALVLLLLSLVCFIVKGFDGHIGSLDLNAFGHVFLVAAFIVGALPAINFTKRG